MWGHTTSQFFWIQDCCDILRYPQPDTDSVTWTSIPFTCIICVGNTDYDAGATYSLPRRYLFIDIHMRKEITNAGILEILILQSDLSK